jgi:outer membrane receptor for Fe3+-dicitrate
MRYRATFFAGLAVGFVIGARAGRERYEQMKKAATQVAQSPPVQKATQAAGEKATQLTKVAKDQAASRVPKLTETAKNGASKVRDQLDRLPGRHPADTGTDSAPAAVNGVRPAD